MRIPISVFLTYALSILCVHAQTEIPHLRKSGDGYQLIVDGKPFRILGGELGNSTASTLESMKEVWPRLKAVNLNTVLIPVYWELLEPAEGEFDFELVDGLIQDARNHNLKIVFLWFGSWKNSMSSYAPSWVKLDADRFPRARSKSGEAQEILSPFFENNLMADLNAYKNLMRHIREVDGNHHTVILMQVENEIGMLPSARDYHPVATQRYEEDVPEGLMNYLIANKENLNPEFLEIWANRGYQLEASWETIFGKGPATEELFMAWYFARYVDRISTEGKAEYDLPVFVNAALNRPGRLPGEYPSAGPLPHVLDIWKAASENIDFYSPDFYNPDFRHWCDLYVRQDNPLFVPEHRYDNTVAAKCIYAFGHYEALGFAPFSIEQSPNIPPSAKEQKLADTYAMVQQILPLMEKNLGQNRINAVLLDKQTSRDSFQLGDYKFVAGHTYNLGWEPNASSDDWEPASAMLIQTGEKEFYYVGFGVSFTMKSVSNPSNRIGILKAERGIFREGKWRIQRHLNGDQTHQGRHIRAFVDDLCIQRFELYEYD